jgi:hypothetical protein
MAIFRKIHTSFWLDSFVQDLTPEQRYFFLYLLTNDKTKQCGIYEITIKQMCYDTGYNDETIKKLISFFTKKNRLMYSESSKEIALKNWLKFNSSTSPKVKTCIESELKQVKNKVLIEYIYSIDTQSQEEQEQEEEQEEEKEESEVFKKRKNKNSAPSKEEFLKYCEERCATVGYNFLEYKEKASIKYDAWLENGWKDLKGSKIDSWKGKVVSNLEYWKGAVKSNTISSDKSGFIDVETNFNYENLQK